MLKVAKFGGSSLSNKSQFEKVKRIIEADEARKVIVVSAPGKQNNKDNKVTDLLYLLYYHMEYGVEYETIFKEIKNRYLEITKDLSLGISLEEDFKMIEDKIKAKNISQEELVSRGEYLQAKILASFIGYKFIDAKDIIRFDYDTKVNTIETYKNIKEVFNEYERIVIPGFYGCYPDGNYCLFSRGGSDVTAAYIAAALDADLYENWTDVEGIHMASPKIIKDAKKITYVTYDELRELSYMGASVIHEETIIPLEPKAIPLEILDTNHSENRGTLILKDTDDKTYLITGITGKKNFIALTFVKEKTSDKLKAILSVLNVFNRYNVPIEHIPTSIDSFSVIVEKEKIKNRYYDIISEIKGNKDIKSISEDNDVSLIAVVGKNMVSKVGTSGRILSIFGEEKINIKLIDQGREEFNIIIGVSNNDFEKSIKALYNRFSNEEGK